MGINMKQERHFIVDVLFVLTLFAVFAISALILVTIGADVYKQTVQDMSNNYDARTTMAYLSEKVRQADSVTADGDPCYCLGYLENVPALILTDEINEEKYDTYLYLHEGYLKELYMRQGAYLGDDLLSAGQKILPLESLSYEQIDGKLLSVSMTTPEGETKQLYLSIHSN